LDFSTIKIEIFHKLLYPVCTLKLQCTDIQCKLLFVPERIQNKKRTQKNKT
jgi:hypothetical protein